MSIWGGTQLWWYSCNNLKNTNLWNFGLLNFEIQLITASICIIIYPLIICIIHIKKSNKEKLNNNLLYQV